MRVTSSETLLLNSPEDIVRVRRKIRADLEYLGFRLVDQTKVVTAASELARNTILHGQGGELLLEQVSSNNRRGLKLTFKDEGPGIQDIEKALESGYSTGSGLGLGLGGAKRLVDEFTITSKPGEGTSVTALKWR